MTIRITIRGQVTIPRRVRHALLLSPGDTVEFHLNGDGEFVFRKAPTIASPQQRGTPRVDPRGEAQIRRRAAELLALLRGLD